MEQGRKSDISTIFPALMVTLQTIALGLLGWVLLTVIDHGDRITRTETLIEQRNKQDAEILKTIRDLSVNQLTALQNQAAFRSEIASLREQLQKLGEKVDKR